MPSGWQVAARRPRRGRPRSATPAGSRPQSPAPNSTPNDGSVLTGSVIVYGDAALEYDFGPEHPLTPRRFPPSIDLIRTLGATNFVEPRVADDDEICRLHTREYVDTVRAISADPSGHPPAAGIGPGDCPPFANMHVASARVVGGSLEGVNRILAGEVAHAFNPAGGLHHASAGRASGFCIYNDVALAAARARDAGHRVMYVDLDVHHGDGTQALFWDDPNVLTLSIHESGHSLFPGTGFIDERGGPEALGTKLNVPLHPMSGDVSWLAALERVLPALAEAFRPTFLVTQHGCDTHAYDPLAHLRLTTRAYRAVTLQLDRLAHEYAGGRWFATGGGGYDAYRVVPRSWALVWLAQAHREPPTETDPDWRKRWAAEADTYGQSPPPTAFLDPTDLVRPEPDDMIEDNARTVERALSGALDLIGRNDT